MESELKEIKETLAGAAEASRLMADALQRSDKQNKRLWITVIVLVAVLFINSFCMVWAEKNAQSIANEAVLNALETVAEMEVTDETTTTTTQSVEGDSATINNVDGEQYNDDAVNGGDVS